MLVKFFDEVRTPQERRREVVARRNIEIHRMMWDAVKRVARGRHRPTAKTEHAYLYRTAHEDPEKSTGFQAGALCKNC